LVYSVTSPANPGDYRLVLIWLVKVKPLPALTIRLQTICACLHQLSQIRHLKGTNYVNFYDQVPLVLFALLIHFLAHLVIISCMEKLHKPTKEGRCKVHQNSKSLIDADARGLGEGLHAHLHPPRPSIMCLILIYFSFEKPIEASDEIQLECQIFLQYFGFHL
jgi:hypothetical protein